MRPECAAPERRFRVNLTLELEIKQSSHFVLYCSTSGSGQTRGVSK